MPHGPVSSFIQPKLMLNLIAFKNIQKGVQIRGPKTATYYRVLAKEWTPLNQFATFYPFYLRIFEIFSY